MKNLKDDMQSEKDNFLEKVQHALKLANAKVEETCSELNALKELFLQKLEKIYAKFLVPLELNFEHFYTIYLQEMELLRSTSCFISLYSDTQSNAPNLIKLFEERCVLYLL